MLYEHRDELRDSRTLISACLAKNLVMDGAGIGAVGVLPGELVGHSVKVLLKDRATKFLTDRHGRTPVSLGCCLAHARLDGGASWWWLVLMLPRGHVLRHCVWRLFT